MSEEKKEQINNRTLIIGVSIFAALFFFLWLFNMQRIIFNDDYQVRGENEDETWKSIQEEFSRGFIEMNQVWEEAQRVQIIADSEIFMENLKESVEKEVIKIENNNYEVSELPQSENESEKEIDRSTSHCPEFVNCMPTYGDLPEDFCVVPPGCEDISLKVY